MYIQQSPALPSSLEHAVTQIKTLVPSAFTVSLTKFVRLSRTPLSQTNFWSLGINQSLSRTFHKIHHISFLFSQAFQNVLFLPNHVYFLSMTLFMLRRCRTLTYGLYKKDPTSLSRNFPSLILKSRYLENLELFVRSLESSRQRDCISKNKRLYSK